MSIYKWKISKYRKDRRTGPVSPVLRSDYLKSLFKELEKINQ